METHLRQLRLSKQAAAFQHFPEKNRAQGEHSWHAEQTRTRAPYSVLEMRWHEVSTQCLRKLPRSVLLDLLLRATGDRVWRHKPTVSFARLPSRVPSRQN